MIAHLDEYLRGPDDRHYRHNHPVVVRFVYGHGFPSGYSVMAMKDYGVTSDIIVGRVRKLARRDRWYGLYPIPGGEHVLLDEDGCAKEFRRRQYAAYALYWASQGCG